MARSNAHRTLQTLVSCGWAVQDPHTSTYRPSLRLFELGALVEAAADIGAPARPHLAALAQATGETIHLAVLDGAGDRLRRQVRQPAAGGGVLAHRRSRTGLLRGLGQGAACGARARRRRWCAGAPARTAGRPHANSDHPLRRAGRRAARARARAATPRIARNGASASAASARRCSTRAALPVAAVGMSVPSIRFTRAQAKAFAARLLACAGAASATLGFRMRHDHNHVHHNQAAGTSSSRRTTRRLS